MSDKPVRPQRNCSDAFKLQAVADTREPGVSVASAARRHGMNANVVFGWLRDARFGGKAVQAEVLPVATRAMPPAPSSTERRPEPLDLTVAFPGAVRVNRTYHPHKAVYAERNRVERFFNRIKHFRAIATRFDGLKLAEPFVELTSSTLQR